MSANNIEELKLKYGLDDNAVAEITGATKAPGVQTPQMQRPGLPSLLGDEDAMFPASLMQSMKSGEMGTMETMLLMDFMDRKEERKRDREKAREGGGNQATNQIQQLIQEMKDSRASTDKALSDQKTYFEQILLGKKIDDLSEQNQALNSQISQRNSAEAERQKFNQVYQYLDERIAAAVPNIQGMNSGQQQGFFDTVFGEIQSEIGQDMKDHLMSRFRGETTGPSPENKGKGYFELAGRALKVLEETLAASKKKPPLQPVQTIQEPPQQPGIQATPASPIQASPDLNTDPIPDPITEPEIEITIDPEAEEAPLEEPPMEVQGIIPGRIHGASDESYLVPRIIEGGEAQPAPIAPPEPIIEETPPHQRIQTSEDPPPGPDTFNELKNISGIGPAFADALKAHGIISVDQLASATPSQIAEVTQIPESKIQDWVTQAKDMKDSA